MVSICSRTFYRTTVLSTFTFSNAVNCVPSLFLASLSLVVVGVSKKTCNPVPVVVWPPFHSTIDIVPRLLLYVLEWTVMANASCVCCVEREILCVTPRRNERTESSRDVTNRKDEGDRRSDIRSLVAMKRLVHGTVMSSWVHHKYPLSTLVRVGFGGSTPCKRTIMLPSPLLIITHIPFSTLLSYHPLR